MKKLKASEITEPDPMREKFEEWAIDYSYCLKRDPKDIDEYWLVPVQAAWMGWQAAWKAKDE